MIQQDALEKLYFETFPEGLSPKEISDKLLTIKASSVNELRRMFCDEMLYAITSYTVEKEGGYGPIYWNLPADDLISAERLNEIDRFKDCLKSYRLHAVSFRHKGIRYDFVGWWGLNWEEDGEDKWLDFHSKKDFRKAPIFDGKNIMEIADQVTDIDIDLEPEWPNKRFYQ